MNWIDIVRIILVVPASIAVIGLVLVLIADIRGERYK